MAGKPSPRERRLHARLLISSHIEVRTPDGPVTVELRDISKGGARFCAAQTIGESGDVILLEPSPKEPRELTRFTALKGKTWNPPAIAGEFLLVRNDKEAACHRLPVATQEHSPALSKQGSP